MEVEDDDVMGLSDEENHGDEQQVLTVNEVLDRLQQAWINEKISPVLLPPLEDETLGILEHLQTMQKNLKTLNKMDMRTEIHRLEVERVKFIVVSYVRTRFFKIQKQAWALYEQEVKRPRHAQPILTDEEFAFIRSYIPRTESYFKAVILNTLPQPLQKLDNKIFKCNPNLDTYVFFRVIKDNAVEVEDDTANVHGVELKQGEQHLMRFRPIKDSLVQGAIALV